MDAALKLAERVIAYKNVRFIIEHQNDTLDQLSAYLAKCMDERAGARPGEMRGHRRRLH